MNSVQIIGNIATDITLHTTKSEKNVATFNVAINDYNTTYFIPISAWNNIALNVNKYCKKGNKIGITGYLRQNSYQDEEGHHHQRITVVAHTIEFLSPKEQLEIVDDEWINDFEEQNQ